MNSIGKIGICLECGYTGSPQSINIAEKNILAFLIAMGHKDGNIVPRRQSHIKLYKKYYSKSDSFKLVKHFKNFDSIQKNQLIGIDGQNDVRAKKRSIILFASNAKNIGEESFLLGEKK